MAERGHRRHQTSTHADADQAPGECQTGEALRRGERGAAEHRRTQEANDDAARAESIEGAAERQLRQCKAQEEGACQQPEITRAQAELGTEIRRQRRGHASQQRREVVGEGKAQEQPYGDPPWQCARGDICVVDAHGANFKPAKKLSTAWASGAAPITLAW